MSRKAAFSAADYARAVQGALKGGLPVGSFKIAVENGALAILPAATEQVPPADQLEDELAAWRAKRGYG